MTRQRALFLAALPFAAIPIALIAVGFWCLNGIDWVRGRLA